MLQTPPPRFHLLLIKPHNSILWSLVEVLTILTIHTNKCENVETLPHLASASEPVSEIVEC